MARVNKIFFGLSWFDKQTEELAGEIPLELTAREVRRILGLPPRSLLTDSIPVTRQHVAALKTRVRHPLDLARFDYFIEAASSAVPAHEHALR